VLQQSQTWRCEFRFGTNITLCAKVIPIALLVVPFLFATRPIAIATPAPVLTCDACDVESQALVYTTMILASPQFGMWSTSSRLQIPLMQHPAA